MIATVTPGKLQGSVDIPGSKSHTIRALIIAALARGESRLIAPLESADTRSCMHVCRLLGAHIAEVRAGNKENRPLSELVVTGGILDSAGSQVETDTRLTADVGNSGTTLTLAAAVAALLPRMVTFTGDDQIAARPIEPLLAALEALGAGCTRAPQGRSVPFTLKGPLHGGSLSIECRTSQYLSALLLAAPLASGDTEIWVPLLHEKPYVEMTLAWLESQQIELQRRSLEWFRVTGGQQYRPFERRIPADFSSATFLMCAAAVTRSRLLLLGLDMSDSQGDKAVVGMLNRLGCPVSDTPEGLLVEGEKVDSRGLEAATLDLNATPDALPALAATACFSRGTVRLVNVPQARLKETDRIKVMALELRKLGALVRELDDGLEITGGSLQGGKVDGWGDHRIVMSLAVLGLGTEGMTEITSAESAEITYPGFFETISALKMP